MRLLGAICLTWALSLSLAPASAAPQASLHEVNQAYSHRDANGDGFAELRSIRSLDLHRTPTGATRGAVLVIAESRLVSSPAAEGLRDALRTHADDLAAEGWAVLGVAMQVYDGPVHQDGRTLLAMREYLRAVKQVVPDFAGVVLVGSFPEAVLIRQYNWRQHGKTTLHKGEDGEEVFGGEKVYRLRSVPEIVASSCDLILADLDGHWERLYHIGPEELPWVLAVYPDAQPPDEDTPLHRWINGGPTPHFERGTKGFQDFFLVNDGRFEAAFVADGVLDVRPLDDLQDAECAEADRERGNPIARPDIILSRIDARHIALKPKAGVRGVDGEGLLDAHGLPQVVAFPSDKETPRGLSVWERDPALEQALLIEFFQRNHRFRRGEFRDDLKPAAIAFDLGSPMRSLVASRTEWTDFDEPSLDVHGDDATLLGAVEWLKRAAILRSINAHSDPWGSHFGKVEDVAALEAACGGQAWSWIREGAKLVPTLGATGKLDFAICRTLWQNRALPDSASLFLHSGCGITSPGAADRYPYSDPRYGYWQGAEALLFYCNGLALVGRSKTFYDFPTDFAKRLGEGATFGGAWAHYFDVESAEPDVRKVGRGIGRKRAYFWQVLGDWTLTLAPES